ncbi:MAG: PilZ domain-containing protein [Pseudorhodoplanes sp.]|uniref:PilZ domain-containing protein n=1 Tax=Pseudorhodoplanes sp. TaxID=1934341 RepID=UPI003D0BF94D
MTLFGRKSRKPRQKVNRSAWLAGDSDFALRPCTIIDMSSEGAKLRTEDVARLPKQFRLTFSRSTRDGKRCDLRWRRGQIFGVKFVP